MFVNGVEWEPIGRSNETDWPIRETDIDDGPNKFAYGRIRLEAPDKMLFIVEGNGSVTELQPRAEPREFDC